MSSQKEQLDKMSEILAQVADQLAQVKLQSERQEEQQRELTAKVGLMEEKLNVPHAAASFSVSIPTLPCSHRPSQCP